LYNNIYIDSRIELANGRSSPAWTPEAKAVHKVISPLHTCGTAELETTASLPDFRESQVVE